jgi:hypothetical protein
MHRIGRSLPASIPVPAGTEQSIAPCVSAEKKEEQRDAFSFAYSIRDCFLRGPADLDKRIVP